MFTRIIRPWKKSRSCIVSSLILPTLHIEYPPSGEMQYISSIFCMFQTPLWSETKPNGPQRGGSQEKVKKQFPASDKRARQGLWKDKIRKKRK